MNEDKETIARALEIAITLTKADHTWLRMGEYNNLIIHDPLFITMKRVIQIMNDEQLHDFDRHCKVSRGTPVKDLS
jgi:hypothetical protein